MSQSDCTWTASSQTQSWRDQYSGSCGVQPTINGGDQLPTNCQSGRRLTAYNPAPAPPSGWFERSSELVLPLRLHEAYPVQSWGFGASVSLGVPNPEKSAAGTDYVVAIGALGTPASTLNTSNAGQFYVAIQ